MLTFAQRFLEDLANINTISADEPLLSGNFVFANGKADTNYLK